MSRKKIAVIGNSFVLPIAKLIREHVGLIAGVEPTFFVAAQPAWVEGVEIDGTRIVPRGSALRESWKKSSGEDALDTARFDGFLCHWTGIRHFYEGHLRFCSVEDTDRLAIEALGLVPINKRLLLEALRARVDAELNKHFLTRALGNPARVTFVTIPAPSLALFGEDRGQAFGWFKPLKAMHARDPDGASFHDHHRWFSTLFRSVVEQRAQQSGTAFLWQPEHTLHRSQFTEAVHDAGRADFSHLKDDCYRTDCLDLLASALSRNAAGGREKNVEPQSV